MSPSTEFFLPLSGRLYTQQQWDELEEKEPQPQQKGKQVYILESVRDVTEDEEQLTAAAEDLSDQLSVSSLSIRDPDNFDILYSICKDFGRASASLQRPTLHAVLAGLSSVRSAADQYVKAKEKKGTMAPPSSPDLDDVDDDQQLGGDLSTSYRSALKMYSFLLTTLINHQEKANNNNNNPNEEEMMLASKGKKKTTGRGKKAAAASINSSMFEWSSQKEKAIGALVDLLHQRSLFSLWRMSSPEEELGSALFSTAMTLLESVDNHKLKGVKDASASLFSSVLLKFPTLLPQAANQLVHALHSKGEALATPLADLVAVASARPYKLSLLLPEILAEVSELDVAMMSKDSGAARALSTFLVEVASRSPRACLAHLPQLEAHLGGESYMMRNGVVQVLGQLVEALDGLASKDKEQEADKNNKKKAKRGGAYEEDDDDSEAEEDARLAAKLSGDGSAGSAVAPHDATQVLSESKARILSMLHTRIHDVNSFTRTKTLQQLTAIVRSRSIKEAAQYVDTLKAAQDRLMDKTAAVRKAAIQLLTALMEMNPFAPLLQLELFQKKLSEKMEEFRAQLEKQHALVANHRAGAAQQQPGGEDEEDEEAEPGAMEVDEEDEEVEEQKEKMADERKEDAPSSSKSSAPTEHSVKALLSSSTLSDLTLERLRSQVDTLFHGVRFIHTLHEEIMPVLHEMFLSKTQSDAIECINFFVVAKEFGLSAPPAAEVSEQGEEGAAAAAHAPPRKLVTVDSGCKKMSGLIWSREPTVRDAVLAAFTRLYLNDELHSRSGPVAKKAALLSIQSLLSIALSSNLSELTSLEEICTKLYYAGSIPSILIDSLWELFASEKLDEAAIKQVGSHTRAAVLTLINFFSNASGFVLSNHVEELVSVGFSGAAISTAPTLVRAACISLQKWNAAIKNAPSPKEAPPAISEKTLAVIFQRMEVLLLNSQMAPPVVYKRGSNSVSSVASAWYSMVEQVLNSIFQLHSTPERFCEKVLHSLMRTLFTAADPSDPSQGGAAALGTGEKLARFLFLLAHVAMRTLVHLEALEKDIKNLKAKRNAAPQIETERIGVDEEEEEEEEETKPTRSKAKKKAAPKKAAASKRKKKRADSDEESEEEVSEEEEEEESEEEEPVKKAPKKRAAAKKSSTAVSSTPVEAPSSLEVELGSYAEAEHELEKLREATEARLIEVRAEATGMLSVFAPIVERIVMTLIPGSAQYGRFAAHPTLQVNAVLALSKLMCLHVSYCEAHLTLLFSVLRAPTTSSTIKANIIIALGDLFLRFPNSIEPYSEHMYHGLKKQVRPVVVHKKKAATSSSSDSLTQRALLDEMFVRKNTLMVLTHLILNDMLKAKGPIAEIAKATQDFHTQPRIAQLAKAFFQELNNKSGDSKATIYNILPDILSRLSNENGTSSVTPLEFQQIFKFLLGFLTKDKQIENLIEKLLHRFELVYVDPVAKVAEQLDNLEVGAGAEQEVKVKKEGGEEEQTVQQLPSLKSTGVPLTSQDVSLKQCRDLSYCLTQLPFNLTSLKKLHSLYRCYASKLGDAETFDNFTAILIKVRKNLATLIKEGTNINMASTNKEKEAVEAKQLCDELEAKWNEQYEKLMEEAATTSKARHARGKKGYGEKIQGEEEEEEEKKHMDTDEEDVPAPSARGGRRLASKAAAAPAPSKSRRGGAVAAKKAAAPAKSTSSSRRKKVESSSEDEEDSEEEEDDDESVDEVSEEEEEEEEVKPKRGGKKAAPAPKKAPAKAASRSRRRIVDSDEEDDDE